MSRRNKKRIYCILLINHGKRLKTICTLSSEKSAYDKFKKLIDENKKVMFPIQYNNMYHEMVESQYEIIMVKCKQDEDNAENKVKNDYGEYVTYETGDEDWIVIDRANYNIEESFWVYGYHPKLQRKSCKWIIENLICKDKKDKGHFKLVQVYLNKILIDCNGKLDMVICKNKSDSIRLYNEIEKWCISNKAKYIIFMGNIAKSKYKSEWIDKIQELTHWNRRKITRHTTRP